jgi:hypothetical protein
MNAPIMNITALQPANAAALLTTSYFIAKDVGKSYHLM